MALVIYKTTDKVWIEIGDVQFAFSPLSLQDKQKVFAEGKALQGEVEQMQFAKRLLALTLKDCKNIQLPDGSEYRFNFNANGELADENINDLLNTDLAGLLIETTSSLLQGVPSGEAVINPGSGLPIAGVKLLKKSVS